MTDSFWRGFFSKEDKPKDPPKKVDHLDHDPEPNEGIIDRPVPNSNF